VTRLPDWEPRLAAYIESVRDSEFAWGKHDCALHSANAVLAVTGDDIATKFRGKYSTARGSLRALKRYGAGTLKSTIDDALPIITPAFAQRGDLVWRHGMVGVCLGADAAFVGEIDAVPGLVRFPRRDWTRAWAVR
jgi:hypothetical protein